MFIHVAYYALLADVSHIQSTKSILSIYNNVLYDWGLLCRNPDTRSPQNIQ
jgi:hypothetical protein